MIVPRLERELAAPVARHLRSQGYSTFLEVPFNGRIADVLGIQGEEVVAVELKLRDYKTAHRQALAYAVGCHRTYVGVPLPTALDCLRRHRFAFEQSGTGLLAVNMPAGDVRELLPSRQHDNRFLPFLADGLRDALT
ncbi:MAG: repair protein MmcB-like [Thermoplasmata archaeon]|nr:repair protein MmcB-like [Thermoplasmata archaeon]